MTPRVLVLFIHALSAILLLGGSMVATPLLAAAARRARTVQELRAAMAIGRPLAPLIQVSSLVLLGSGIYLATAAHFWTLAWVQVAATFWVVNAVVAGRFHKPALMQLAAAAFRTPDGPVPADIDAFRRSSRFSLPGNVLIANNTAMLYQMIAKPGLTGSLLAVAIANAVVLAGVTLAAVRRAPAPVTADH